jgi:hypothetical protein
MRSWAVVLIIYVSSVEQLKHSEELLDSTQVRSLLCGAPDVFAHLANLCAVHTRPEQENPAWDELGGESAFNLSDHQCSQYMAQGSITNLLSKAPKAPDVRGIMGMRSTGDQQNGGATSTRDRLSERAGMGGAGMGGAANSNQGRSEAGAFERCLSLAAHKDLRIDQRRELMGGRARAPNGGSSSSVSAASPLDELDARAQANNAYLDALLPTLGEMNQVARTLGQTVDDQANRLDSILDKEESCAESMKLLNRRMNRINGGRCSVHIVVQRTDRMIVVQRTDRMIVVQRTDRIIVVQRTDRLLVVQRTDQHTTAW